jgi:hypothetical protein
MATDVRQADQDQIRALLDDRKAMQDPGERTAQGPAGDAVRPGDSRRARIPARLAALAAAWRDTAAWAGMAQAGGIDLPPRWPRRSR